MNCEIAILLSVRDYWILLRGVMNLVYGETIGDGK